MLLLMPTAEESPVPWRYTTEKPADDWFKPDLDLGIEGVSSEASASKAAASDSTYHGWKFDTKPRRWGIRKP